MYFILLEKIYIYAYLFLSALKKKYFTCLRKYDWLNSSSRSTEGWAYLHFYLWEIISNPAEMLDTHSCGKINFWTYNYFLKNRLRHFEKCSCFELTKYAICIFPNTQIFVIWSDIIKISLNKTVHNYLPFSFLWIEEWLNKGDLVLSYAAEKSATMVYG